MAIADHQTTRQRRVWFRCAGAPVAVLLAGMLPISGCRTAPPPRQAAQQEAALLDVQSAAIQQALAQPGGGRGAASGLQPGEIITVNAWHQDLYTPLAGYPLEVQIPEADPLFLPHFGLVQVVNQSVNDLQKTLLERFNARFASLPTAVVASAAATPGIRAGDDLSISVWLRDNISMPPGFPYQARVGASGDVFVPLLGAVPAADLTVADFQAQLQGRFSKILQDCKVVVVRGERRAAETKLDQPLAYVSIRRKLAALAASGSGREAVEIGQHFIVLGRVGSPGLYPLKPGLHVRDALAMAGGMARYAHPNIFLVRGTAERPEVMRIDMNDIVYGRTLDKNVALQPNDAIYVAPKALWNVADFISLLLLPIMQLRDAVYLYDRFAE